VTRERGELITLIKLLSERFPSLRLCQLIANAVEGCGDVYFVTDKDLLKLLLKYERSVK
jgi:hypothetical protein